MAGIRLSAADLEGAQVLGEAAPAARGGIRLSAADLEGVQDLDAPTPDVNGVESAGRGLIQGLTFGFADEIAGGIEALTSNKTYSQARDESRAAFAAAREAHPWLYAGGELASAFVPGTGAAKLGQLAAKGGKALLGAGRVAGAVDKGLKSGNALVRGATATAQSGASATLAGAADGAISGLGSSESETIGGMMTDAITGGAVGGTLSGVLGAVVGGASSRLRSRAVARAGDKGTAVQRDALAKVQDDFADMVFSDKGKPLRDALGLSGKGLLAGKDSAKVVEAVDDMLKPLMESRRGIYKAIDAAADGGGIKVQRLMDEVSKAREAVAGDPGKRMLVDAYDKIRDDMAQSWSKQEAVPSVKVREFISDLQERGFGGAGSLEPGVAKKMKQELARTVKSAFDNEIAEIAAKAPKVAPQVSALREVNSQMSTLIRAKDIAQRVSKRDAFPATGLRDIASKGVDAGLLFSGNVSGLVAKKAGEFALPRAAVGADLALAKLVNAARAGNRPAQIAKLAMELGLPISVARKVVADFGGKEQQETYDWEADGSK